MVNIFRAYNARRRLEAVQHDIEKYGEGCPQMFLMQRDMIEKEVEHYQEESTKFTKKFLIFIVICIILVEIYKQRII